MPVLILLLAAVYLFMIYVLLTLANRTIKVTSPASRDVVDTPQS
ncbi:MAG: hypothetical protein ACRDEA_18455 [Microcystaceae cyanobacterium]